MSDAPLDNTLDSYRTSDGRCPFDEWHASLRDGEARRRILI